MRKRLWSILLVLCMVLSLVPVGASAAKVVDSGKYGDNLTWTLTDDGVLTIDGTGAMQDSSYEGGLYKNWNDIQTVIINSGVTSIGKCAFSGLHLLKSISIADTVTSIGQYAFISCYNLTEIIIPKSVKKIDHFAFENCESLEKLTLQEGLTSIASSAFIGCNSLKSITIPSSVTSLGDFSDETYFNPFDSCSSLQEIKVSGGNKNYKSIQGALLNKSGTDLICCPRGKIGSYTIPDGVNTIRDMAFRGCENLTSVTIPEGVSSIPYGTFTACSSLTSLTIPNSVTSIGLYAFDGCRSLTDVYYGGTRAQWNKIKISEHNDPLTALTEKIHYESSGPDDSSDVDSVTLQFDESSFTPDANGKVTLAATCVSKAEFGDSEIKWSCSDPSAITFAGNSTNGPSTTLKDNTYWISTQATVKKAGEYTITLTVSGKSATTIVRFVNGNEGSDSTISQAESERKEEYIKQHIDFISSKTYSERLANSWAYEIADGEHTPAANVAEALYDVLNTGKELVSGEKLSILDNPYTAILTDLILAQTDKQVADYQLKYKVKWLGYIQKLEKVCEKADPNWTLNEKEYKTYLERIVENPDSVNDSFYQLCKNTFGRAMSDGLLDGILNVYQKVGVTLEALDSFGEVVNWVSDCLKFNAMVDAYLATSEEFKQTLIAVQNQMYRMASQHDVASLRISYNDYKDAVAEFQKFQTEENIVPMLFKQYTTEGAFKITKVFSGALKKNAALFLKSKGVASASWIYAAIEAYKTGWSISEDITQNGDVMDCKKLSRAYYYLEYALLSVVQSKADVLKNAKTYEAARGFDAAYVMLQDVECGAIVNYIKLLDVEHSSIAHSIKNRGILPSWQTAHFNFAEISNMAIEKMKWEMANCHDAEAESVQANYQTISQIAVCCPTDVYVYDTADKLVCRIKDNSITRKVDDIIVNAIDDQKYLVIPDLSQYRIEIRATDAGTMDYYVGTYQFATGGKAASVDYINVELNKGDIFQSETRAKKAETSLAKEQEIIQPNYRNEAVVPEPSVVPSAQPTVQPTTQPSPEPYIPADDFGFADVAESAYYYDAVLWALEHDPQITTGMDSTHFAPNKDCTRAQMVTFLWRAAGEPKPESTKNPFTDVKKGAYYYDAVLWAVEQGITTGTSKTTFSPDATVTRAQTVTFLWRMEGEPAVKTKNPFTDVKSGQYYTDAVLWAVKNDITNGLTATTFGPANPCTRAQIVTFLWRAMA